MENTIQLYSDREKKNKVYPITSPDRVIDENGVNIKEQFDNGVEISGAEIGLRFNRNEEISVLMKEIVDNGIDYYYPMIKRSQEVVKLYTIEESANKVYSFYCDILKN